MKTVALALTLIAAPLALPAASFSPAVAATQRTQLGDLSKFENIANDTLVLVSKGDLNAAQKRITDFETAWDNAEPTLYPKNKSEWSTIDDAADKAISSLRAKKPMQADAQAAVTDLVDALRP